MRSFVKSIIISVILFHTIPLFSQPINDDCSGAIELVTPQSDQGFTFINGTTIGATPEMISNACGIDKFPTVWYKVKTDNNASLLNISVSSTSIYSPSISLYFHDCINPIPIQLNNGYPCANGTSGTLLATAHVGALNTYYIAVTSYYSLSGDFVLGLSSISQATNCVINANVLVAARSNPGPLSGPFEAGEKITFNLNVNSYTAANNNCQWFQGIIPNFGNGWDPSSFDTLGQPLLSNLNNVAIGDEGNGVYGSSTWDWFTNVEYHYDHPNMKIGDIDGNGTNELCNVFYNPDCVGSNIIGACCGPCWDAEAGTTLPGGWFAYGINGTCNEPGPPIGVDWGDGGNCGTMGPWTISFDLIVRPEEELLLGLDKLSVGFVSFADGEIGAWVGGPSVCALDAPQYEEYDLVPVNIGMDTADYQTTNTWKYIIEADEQTNWTAAYLPEGFELVNQWTQGDQEIIFNVSPEVHLDPYVTIRLLNVPNFGRASALDVVFPNCVQRDLKFPDEVIICSNIQRSVNIKSPFNLPWANYHWLPGNETTSTLTIPYNSSLTSVSVIVTDSFGCQSESEITITRRFCELVTDNDVPGPTPTDPYPFDGGLTPRNSETKAEPFSLIVYPNPAKEEILIDWGTQIENPSTVTVYNVNGVALWTQKLDRGFDRRIAVQTGSYASGTYIVVFTQKDKTSTTRFIKF